MKNSEVIRLIIAFIGILAIIALLSFHDIIF